MRYDSSEAVSAVISVLVGGLVASLSAFIPMSDVKGEPLPLNEQLYLGGFVFFVVACPLYHCLTHKEGEGLLGYRGVGELFAAPTTPPVLPRIPTAQRDRLQQMLVKMARHPEAYRPMTAPAA